MNRQEIVRRRAVARQSRQGAARVPEILIPDEQHLAGTTTTCKAGVHALMIRHGVVSGAGMLDASGILVREPDNPVDIGAVAVHVEGERVGYLFSGDAGRLPLGEGAIAVPVRFFTADTPRGFRVEGWAWLGRKSPRWTYHQENRPPLTSDEKRMANHKHSRSMVADAIATGGHRAERFAAGMVDGIHYLELVEPIKHLKREGRLDEALILAYKAIAAAEQASKFEQRRVLPPFYTEQAAIILRKLGRRDEEITVLRRWIAGTDPEYRGSTMPERLAKLTGARPELPTS